MYLKVRLKEYDIESCNINILKRAGVITDELYHKLANGGKDNRVKYIGNMIKDKPVVYDILQAGIKEILGMFIESNNITEDMIYERNHDAIWIRSSKPIKNLVFDSIRLVCKRDFTSMLTMDKGIIYYNSITGDLDARYIDKSIIDRDGVRSLLEKVMGFMEGDQHIKAYTVIHDYNTNIEYWDFIHDLLDALDL